MWACVHTQKLSPEEALWLSLGWPSTEKLPCTDGGAAACTVVGPPRAGERGRAHSEVAPTTFLSWQLCTLSSGPVQANGFAAALPSPGVNEAHASGLCIWVHSPYLNLSTKSFPDFISSFPPMDFPLGCLSSFWSMSELFIFLKFPTKSHNSSKHTKKQTGNQQRLAFYQCIKSGSSAPSHQLLIRGSFACFLRGLRIKHASISTCLEFLLNMKFWNFFFFNLKIFYLASWCLSFGMWGLVP